MRLLHIDSSILGQGSVSRTLSAAIVAALRATHKDLEVTYHDLAADPLAHLTSAHLAAAKDTAAAKPAERRGVGASLRALWQKQDDAGQALRRDLDAGQAALEEFLAADIVVVGVPMYNFSVPSQLKAWIDRIAVAGRTFRYTEKGPEGLVGGKTVIVASSRGGVFGPGTPGATFEHQESYLRAVFGFLGVTDIRFVRAEGVAMGSDARASAIMAAKDEALRIAA